MTLQNPNKDVKRRYSSPRRETQAQETKTLILDAAAQLFTSKGFTETTIKDVAREATVSEQTIYNVFGDKTGLLHQVGLYFLESDENQYAELVDALRAEPDAKERIRIVARDSRLQWETGALEFDRLVFGTDVNDPRLADLEEQVLAYKLEVNRAICEVLFPDSIRRGDVSIEEIAEFTTAIDSAQTVRTLIGLGWTTDQWENWVVQLLTFFLDPTSQGDS